MLPDRVFGSQGASHTPRVRGGIGERLHQEHAKSMQVEGFCERTLMSRFGEVTVRRRLYQDDRGEYHLLLDEHLSWRPNQEATPSLTAALVDSATKLSFRKASVEAEKYSAGVLSATTVHRLLQSELLKIGFYMEYHVLS